MLRSLTSSEHLLDPTLTLLEGVCMSMKQAYGLEASGKLKPWDVRQ